MSAKKKPVFVFDERSYETGPSALPAGSELAPARLLADDWTIYQPTRAREKSFYDIKLRDGEVVECCYPNGNSWYPMHPNKRSGHARLPDYRVLEIRKCQHPMDIADESSANDRISDPAKRRVD